MCLHLAQTFSEDKIDILDNNITITDYNSPEDHASHILGCHYDALSQSLHCPAVIAPLISLEISGITKDILRSIMKSVSENNATILLLKAVCQAVHTNYHNLEVFASVLLKFSSVQCAKAILNDCGKYASYIICPLLQFIFF